MSNFWIIQTGGENIDIFKALESVWITDKTTEFSYNKMIQDLKKKNYVYTIVFFFFFLTIRFLQLFIVRSIDKRLWIKLRKKSSNFVTIIQLNWLTLITEVNFSYKNLNEHRLIWYWNLFYQKLKYALKWIALTLLTDFNLFKGILLK